MAELLTVPYLGTAEQDVLVVEWLIDEGQAFRRGETLLVLETLKASFEVEAESNAVLLRRLAEEGARVPMYGVLGVHGGKGERVDDATLERLRKAHEATLPADPVEQGIEGEASATPGRRERPLPEAAPLARQRAVELGVALENVSGTGPGGLIRVEDVELSARASGDGWLDPDFLERLERDEASLAAETSEMRVALYREHGACIGKDVRFGKRVLPRVERMVLGDRVVLGDDCQIEAKELVAGELTQIGSRSRLRCRSLRFGENAFFAADVEVGGGGAMDPEAELVIGSHGFVGEHAHLNACRRLEIGDEVVVSRSAVLMTHSFGGNVLRGFPNRFAGIEIGSYCQIGIGAVLFPGVSMGEGSVLLSGSSLVTAMPAWRLWGGVPARDIKASTRELDEPARLEIATWLVEEFARQLELRGFSLSLQSNLDERLLLVRREGRQHRLLFAPELPAGDLDLVEEDLRVGLAASDALWDALPVELAGMHLGRRRIRGALGPLGEAFREYLRKHGVRLSPRTWTYPGGWL